MLTICIAVPTFRRPAYLPDLFAALAAVETPADCTVSVLVADNDPEASARDAATAAAASFPFPLVYRHVARPGLSSVRNAMLDYARENGAALAMLDDDELPAPFWLRELVRIARSTAADAVVGPVHALLPAGTPRWMVDFRAREYPAFTDGQRVGDGWSSNCLLMTSHPITVGLHFDPALNFSGGEDQLFFRQLLAAGGSITFASGASVYERLTNERRTIGFVLKRSYRRGTSLAFCDRRLAGTARGIALRAAKGLTLIALGLVRIVPVSLMRGSTGAVASSLEIARGAGMVAGLFGASYESYGRSV
jgi:succinoglycan biosynthesis protein ExoM